MAHIRNRSAPANGNGRNYTSNIPLQVRTNSFVVRRRSADPWYQYYEFVPELEKSRRAYEIIDRLQRCHPQYFNPRAVYDGKANLYSKRGDIPTTEIEVNMSSDPRNTKRVFRLRLALARKITPDDIEQMLVQNNGPQGNIDTSTLNLLQIVVRQAANMRHGYPRNARAFYVKTGARDLACGLQAWRGFFQSVRPVIGRLLLNVDAVSALMYQPGPLTDLAMRYLGKRNIRDLERLSQSEFLRLRSFLKGVQVSIETARTERGRAIGGLVADGGGYEFEKDGVPTTVQEHYRQVHNKHLRCPHIFGVRIGRDAIFPAEVCNVVPGQLYKKKMPAEIAPDFLKFSTQRPDGRLRTIQDAIAGPNQLFDYDTSDFMRSAGVEVESDPITITGRVMPTPQILYGGNVMDLQDKSGAWNVVGQQLLAPKPILTWAVVIFDSKAERETVNRFLFKLSQNLQERGVETRSAPVIAHGNQHQPAESVEKAARSAGTDKPPTLVLALLPSSAAEIRRAIKYWGDVHRGVPTQCVRAGKWESAKDQYCNNLALKINAKIGGVNSKLVPTAPSLQGLVPPWTMVIGADIGHPGPGVSNRPSVTSLVASVDPDCSEYAAFTCIQAPRLEIIAHLKRMLQAAIYQFLRRWDGKRYPERIVFYRDGVSEGEYARVAREEIATINDCLNNFVKLDRDGKPVASGEKAYSSGGKPKLLFIVVGKRHHVRFFPLSPRDADRSGNCPPGFVVDDQITSPVYPNFYLQSHSGIQGTSRPAHYIVLYNEIGLTMEQCQRLSYDLCHVYASATRSVSIPAPVYYADRVCARAENHFDDSLRFADSDYASTSGEGPFDLSEWERGFKPAAGAMVRKMYFL